MKSAASPSWRAWLRGRSVCLEPNRSVSEDARPFISEAIAPKTNRPRAIVKFPFARM